EDGIRDRNVTGVQTCALPILRQEGTRDPLLFPMLPNDFLADAGKRSGRCQVMHADAETIWTLSRGRLQRVESAFHPRKGPELLRSEERRVGKECRPRRWRVEE